MFIQLNVIVLDAFVSICVINPAIIRKFAMEIYLGNFRNL